MALKNPASPIPIVGSASTKEETAVLVNGVREFEALAAPPEPSYTALLLTSSLNGAWMNNVSHPSLPLSNWRNHKNWNTLASSCC
ncbi:uncharacterized protein G2W53_019767 [Senna tora]|uniref:Uncharacterized protein n=1 Tax=Senna tora TaxID=362788 RepID=A0A834WPI3_9FABA|nr:uncharacterized protein G2W53_019767 [Senna tora]